MKRRFQSSLTLLWAWALCLSASGEEPRIATPADVRATAAHVRDLIKANQFSEADGLLVELVRNKRMTGDGRRLLAESYRILDEEPSLGPAVETWCSSPRPSHVAFLLRGRRHIAAAWRARGGGFASTVSAQGMREFEDELRLARADLERANRLMPEDPNPAIWLIDVTKGLGLARPEMEKWFDAARKADPFEVLAYERKLDYLLPKWLGSREEAEQFVRACESEAPKGSRVYTVRLNLLTEWADRSEDHKAFWSAPATVAQAKAIHERWLRDFPRSSEARVGLAEVLSLADEEDRAIAVYGEALEVDPEATEILLARGKAHSALQEYSEAEDDFKRVLRLEPSSPSALVGLGNVAQYGHGDYVHAREFYLKALERRPKNARYLVELARSCLSLGLREEALTAFDKATETSPPYAYAYYRRGMALWFSDRSRAEQDLRRAVELDEKLEAKAQSFRDRRSGWERLCAARDGAACLKLGSEFNSGDPAPRDFVRARGFFEKACDCGNAEACAELGLLYSAGKGGEPNAEKAVQVYTRGCDAGGPKACNNLANLFRYGRPDLGDPSGRYGGIDLPRAVALYEKACEGGHKKACESLGDMVLSGSGVAADPGRAASLFTKACEAGSDSACQKATAMTRKAK